MLTGCTRVNTGKDLTVSSRTTPGRRSVWNKKVVLTPLTTLACSCLGVLVGTLSVFASWCTARIWSWTVLGTIPTRRSTLILASLELSTKSSRIAAVLALLILKLKKVIVPSSNVELCTNLILDEDWPFVEGDLKWITLDPGRQSIGSFHPITDGDWSEGTYFQPDTEQLCIAVNSNNINTVKACVIMIIDVAGH